jgi:hypothetical protein
MTIILFPLPAQKPLPDDNARAVYKTEVLKAGKGVLSLNGNYTIGGNSPDYNTINEAIQALDSLGVSGTVIFDIASGTYPEQISMQEVSGAGPNQRIVFQSASGQPNDVVITFIAADSCNYTWRLDGADYVSLKNLTLQANDLIYARVIVLQNGADHNHIDNCNIICHPLAQSYGASAGVYDASGLDQFNIITNNSIFNGLTGIESYGDDIFLHQEGMIIENNTIIDYHHTGIHLRHQMAPKIKGNKVVSNPLNGSASGIKVKFISSQIEILANQVILQGTAGLTGIEVYSAVSPDSARGLIANNMISILSSSNATHTGIYCYCPSHQRLYHNSVNILSGSGSSKAMYLLAGDNNDLLNNIFCNTGGGYAIYTTGSTFTLSDHNNYYSNGNNLGYWSGNVSDIVALQTASGMDLNSVSLDPVYFLSEWLYPTNPNLDNLGTPLPDVTTDFEGEARNLIQPDLGCLEFMVTMDDAGVYALLNPDQLILPGFYDFTVRIKNYGQDSLLSCIIHYSIQGGITDSVFWTGFLLPDSISDSISIGSHHFQAGNHLIKTWTSSPNANLDENPKNDTLVVWIKACNLVQGTYTIGDTVLGADFPTFQAAVDFLSSCGINGAVTFLIDSGNYEEQVVIPEIPGADSSRRIVFRSASGVATDVILTYPVNDAEYNYVLKLDGADFISLNHISVVLDSASILGNSLILEKGANHNTFQGCALMAPETANPEMSIVYSGNTADNDNCFDSCYFFGGYNAIRIIGPPKMETGYIFSDCIIENWHYCGIWFRYQNGIQLIRNQIRNRSSLGLYHGVNGEYSKGSMDISYNIIQVQGSGYGNALKLFSIPGDSSTPMVIYNNVFTGSQGSHSDVVHIREAHPIFFHHNTIQNFHPSETTSALKLQVNSPFRMENNLITSTKGLVILLMTCQNYGIESAEKNIYYTGGPEMVGVFLLGFLSTLPDWVAFSGVDSTSAFLEPGYTGLNLRVPSSGLINNYCNPIPWITDDILGLPRSVSPDPGAIEFDPYDYEAELVDIISPVGGCGQTTDSVSIRILNKGGHIITNSLEACFQMEGDSNLYCDDILTSFDTGDTILFTFSHPLNIQTATDTIFRIRSWISLASDPVCENDTTSWFEIPSLVIPEIPKVQAAYVNAGNPASLSVLNTNPYFAYRWYSDSLSPIYLSIGNTYQTPPLFSTTVYYVESVDGYGPSSISTDLSGVDWSKGCMFDLHPQLPMVIDGFGFESFGGSAVDIYYKNGTYSGFENDSSVWTFLGTYPFTTTMGNALVMIDKLNLNPGQTYGLYLTKNSGTMQHSFATSTNQQYQNSQLQISLGAALNQHFATVNLNRVWNGTIFYTSGNGCISPKAPDSVYVSYPIIHVNLGNDTGICLGDSIQLIANASGGNGVYSYTWNPSNSLNSSNIQNPLAFPLSTTSYTVTLTDANGDTGSDGIIVTVHPLPVVSFNLPVDTVYKFDAPFTLTGGSPVGGTYSGPGVSGGMFHPAWVVPAQTYTMIYTYTNPITGCISQATADIFVRIWANTTEESIREVICIFPNPSQGSITISVQAPEGLIRLSLLDPTGRMLLGKNLLNTHDKTSHRLDMSSFPAGVYFIHLQGENHNKAVKLILHE